MSRLPFYLGVDAGNSKTVALVCDETGAVVGSGRSGNGDIYGAASEQAAVEAVVSAVNAALTTAAVDAARIDAAAFRLAGVDWPEDYTFWVGALTARLPALADLVPRGRCSILNDGFAAIRCGEPTGVAVAVVAGTGTALAARGPVGDEWSMSFWVQGEAHGAGGLVGAALQAVYRAELGLGSPTVLTKRMLAFFGHADVEEMLHQFTRRGGGPSRPGHTAAREVVGAALEGDVVAQTITDGQGVHLATYARAAAARVGFRVGQVVGIDPAAGTAGVGRAEATDGGDGDEVPVVLAGSVLAAPDSPVTSALLAELAETFPRARPRLATLPPISGATLDALAEAGIAVTPGVVDRLRETAPPPAFLQT